MARRDLSSLLPGVKYGHKVYANEIAGLIGLPHVGEIIYVDPSAGDDTANSGSSQDNALKTVAVAFGKATSGNHDVIIIAPSGGTGRTTETTAIIWNKRFTHLIGSAAPALVNVRAGMTFAAGGSLVVSENGCIFKSLTFTSSADIDETVSVTGNRNVFINVDFKGTSNSTSADDTKWRALNLDGAEENYFGGCTLGGDTFTRGVANTTLELEGASMRNTFDDCFFTAHIDTAGTPTHVLVTGTSGIDRENEFHNTRFYSFSTNNGQAMTGCMDLSAQTGTGHILVTGLPWLSTGITDWEASASGRIQMQSFNTATATIGIAINPTV